jgi:ubiquitin-protein ligase
MFAGKLSCETAFPFKSPTTRFEGEVARAETMRGEIERERIGIAKG